MSKRLPEEQEYNDTILCEEETDMEIDTYEAEKEANAKNYASSWYQKAASGDIRAQYNLGMCYEIGFGVKEDKFEAFQWYQKVTENGNNNAQNKLYQKATEKVDKEMKYILDLFYKSNGIKMDKFEAYNQNQIMASAQNKLGIFYEYGFGVENSIFYENGIGVKDDQIEAFKWIKKAAEQGCDFAQNKLGIYYKYGIGVEEDEFKAFYWYQKATENGNKNAFLNLGICYKDGIGIEKDEVKAFNWYAKAAGNENSDAQNELEAASKGHSNAQYNLGLCYEEGIGTSKDLEEAFYWYHETAKNEEVNIEAQNKLGSFYEYGIGTEKDEEIAFYWYQEAAENGNKDAQYNLGNCYEHGIGIEKDKVKAFYWHQEAAENENEKAQFNLAAENGNKEAQNKLGSFYEDGIGIEKDEIKAFKWYQKAAKNGNKNAQYNLGKCYEYGVGIKKDEVKAFKWYKESAEQDFSNAQNKLGFFYKSGKGVGKNMEKAIYWFKKAEKGFEDATGWIKNTLEYEKIKHIPCNELKSAVSLHAGGFGHVTRAVWTKTNDYVVCKKLTNTTDIKHGLLDAFIHELKIHLHLDYCDRIVRCLGISTDQRTNEYLLVMQYANGGDLQNYLKKNFKNLTWNDKKKLAFQIADGLNYLHNENVLHRDLHSKNVVIHENNAKITDFGISKFQNNQSSTVYIGNFGVVAYMEPKRILDPSYKYTKSSDIYSFGVLMWEISSGYPPFKDHDNKVALAISINTGIREVAVPNTPDDYEKLYKNCWNQEPEQRPNINEVLDEFERMDFGINVKNKSVTVSMRDDTYLGSELQTSKNGNKSLDYAQSSGLCIEINEMELD
ncbi:kinase-like domain-containing protein [Rhizophagus irregularis DAOM 181602=DAOM 197198]|nr:kinase-like domain-containing protein [Rhizophagus irregularis DAOM 181602=DAOM 197198]